MSSDPQTPGSPDWSQIAARMDALTEANLRMLRRQQELEQRLQRMEAALNLAPPPPEPVQPLAWQPVVPAPPATHIERIQAPPPLPPPPPPDTVPGEFGSAPFFTHPQENLQASNPTSDRLAPADAQQPNGENLETQVGLTWINRIGAITLILGVAFFFKYAIDNEWIGESGRVILGLLFGFAALFGGDRLWNRDQKTFAHGLTGLGISILYLSFYAAFGFYRLIPREAAFVLMVVTTAASGALSLRYNSMAIAVLALIGGYLTPLSLSTGQDAPWVFFSYLFVLNAGALTLARRQAWRALEILAFVATFFLYFGWYQDRFDDSDRVPAALFAALFYLSFVISPLRWIPEIAQFLVNAAYAGATARDPGAYFLMTLPTAALGVYLADRRNRMPLLGAALAGFWVLFWAWENHPDFREWTVLGLTAGFAIFFAWVPARILRDRDPGVTGLVSMPVNGAAFFAAAYGLVWYVYKDWMGLFAAAVAAIHLGAAMMIYRWTQERSRDIRPALLAAGIALGFLTLAIPLQFSAYHITIAWALEGAALSWIAFKLAERRVYWGAWAVLALALVRIVTIDLAFAGDWTTMRLFASGVFFTLLLSAVSFALGAYWSRSQGPIPAGILLVLAHALMIGALHSQLTIWALQNVSPEYQRNTISLGLSAIITLYAVALIVSGVVRAFTPHRILGLILIGLVVAKLYLMDVWDMGRLFRTLAFLGLGAMLLATSYLYSRYRKAIARFWRGE